MSNDTRSTVIGLIVACVIAAGTYLQTGADMEQPLSWIGLLMAIGSTVKGYYHNKPEPSSKETA